MVDVLQRRDQNSGKLLFFCSDVYEAQNTNQSGLTSLLCTIPHCLITQKRLARNNYVSKGRFSRSSSLVWFTCSFSWLVEIKMSWLVWMGYTPLAQLPYYFTFFTHPPPPPPYHDPQILHNLCFPFLLGITAIPKEIENNDYAKLGGGSK